MDTCSIFQTYLSLSDWIKALWLVAPGAFALGLAWNVVHRPRS